MVYLDQFSRKKVSKRISKRHWQGLLEAVIDMLQDWRFSPFQNEGVTRRALRNYFIERGQPWPFSDDEAAAVIAQALDLMGAKRPSWLEGQWVYTASRDSCLWCAEPIDEQDQADGRRFCSAMCAKSCMEKRVRRDASRVDWIYQRALVDIAHWQAEPRPCKQCARPFRDRFEGRLFCSTACHDAYRRFPDIACQECGCMFHPADHNKKYCSRECSYKGALKTKQIALPAAKMCQCCLTMFRPKIGHAIYCSTRCNRMMANRAYRARQRPQAVPNVIYLTREIFDRAFGVAA